MRVSSGLNKQSITWRASIGFVVLATLGAIAIGYPSYVGWLPIRRTVEFRGGELQFMRLWMKLAVPVAIILPATAFVVGFRYFKLRKVFGFYLLLLGIQIVTEQAFSQSWMPSLVVPVGTLYTSFRVWQLKQGLQLTQSARNQQLRYRLLSGVLWLLFCFWLSNLVVLLVVAWPNILPLSSYERWQFVSAYAGAV